MPRSGLNSLIVSSYFREFRVRLLPRAGLSLIGITDLNGKGSLEVGMTFVLPVSVVVAV